ncbi:hypothetical protein F9L00_22795 [Brucella anthropi]|uniref:Uncharacterized protein n=1 Tax=Brucella anthropi TaxID=529 RepID=A0A6L3Z3I5_BRUAN|nr:hypothetical protein [Brucella anthropi]KAB2766790.1 hypothetical protein F9L04_16080 [Brucella anthropi]KAB2774073.1 hypothetical protein F9L00_22795 [Brucella anthropi]
MNITDNYAELQTPGPVYTSRKQADSLAAFIDQHDEPVHLADIVKNFPNFRTSTVMLAIGKTRTLDLYLADNSAELLARGHHLLTERAALSDEDFATRLDQLVTLAKCSAATE